MRSVGPDSKQSWVVALACFVIQIMAYGLTEVSGLFFVATIPRFQTKRELASLPYTLTYCVRSALGPLIGYLGHRFGTRQVTLVGGIVSAIAVGGCFFAEDIVPIIILWGVVFGFSLGLETSLLNVILNEHFVKNRVKANGLNAAGASIGNMLLSPIITYLIEEAYGLSGTFLIISGFMLNSIPAAIIMILNKPQSSEAEAYTSDIESVLKARTSVVPAIDVKMERRFSHNDSQSRSLETRDSNRGTDVDNFCTKTPLISILTLECHALSNEYHLTFPYYDERKLRSKSASEVGIVTDIQTDNAKLSREWNEMYAMFSFKNHRSKSLVPNPNHLNVIPEIDSKMNLPLSSDESSRKKVKNNDRTTLINHDSIAQSIRNNNKYATLGSMRKTLINEREMEAKGNKTSVRLGRDENQITATSLSELTKNVWKNGGAYYNSNLEIEYNSTQTSMTNNNSICISNNEAISENGKSVLSPTSLKIGDESKWNIYRLACDPVYLLLLVGSSIYYFCVTSFLTIIVDYATDIGLSITYSSYILIWVGAWDIVGYAVLGFIIERGYITQVKFASLSYLGMCLTSAAMVWAPSYIVLLAILTLFEFSQAGVIILAAPIIAELIDPDLQETAIASVTLLSAPVSLVISPLIGFFRDGYGSYAGLFYVNSGSSLLCCLLFLCIPRVKQRRKA